MSIEIGINSVARHARLSGSVSAERDRRIEAGFLFAGHMFQLDLQSKARITGAATLAGFAIGAGVSADDLRWNGAAVDFTWLSQSNAVVPMDAPTCFAFGAAAAEHERAHIFAARALKDLAQIPADYADDAYWPAAV
jgi:hypothetical protein